VRLVSADKYYHPQTGEVVEYEAGTVCREASGEEMLDFILTESEHEWSIPSLIRAGYNLVVMPDDIVRLIHNDNLVRAN